jgi:glucokinase
MTTPPRIGVDLGGSNFRVAAFAGGDTQLATPAEVHKEPVGEARDPASIVDRIASHVERLATPYLGARPLPVGIGLAAMLRDRRGTVANSPHLRWRDVNFGEQLKTRLGPRFTLGIYNDVNAIAWGEAVAGAARGCQNVLAVFVGTGIGGGVIAEGKLVEGASNCAGEIGHVKVRWGEDAAPCACGSRGCVEAYVGGSYVAARIAKELATGVSPATVALAGSLAAVTPSHVDQAAADGDEWALDLWTELAPLLAIALGNAIALLNSERLVLGGGLLGRTPTLYEQVELALAVAAPAASLEPLTVVRAELGDDAGLVGASALAAAGISTIQ